jgi:hypothetical protein
MLVDYVSTSGTAKGGRYEKLFDCLVLTIYCN